MSDNPLSRLRQTLRQQRKSLPASSVKTASVRICQAILSLKEWQSARHIGIYYAMEGEPDICTLSQEAGNNRQFYLPVLREDGALDFLPFHPQTPLVTNRFGIPEPRTDAPAIPVSSLDLVFVPLVAFDADCHRLGMGAGYYDRTFVTPPVPRLFGVAHAFQKVHHLDQNPWDVPLDGVITPEMICYRRPHDPLLADEI